MLTASAKNKGRLLQKWAAKVILKAYPELKEADVQSTSMGAGGIDIKLSTKAKELFPFSIECKSHNAFSVYGYVEQAMDNCKPDTIPLVIIKANHKKPLAIVDAEFFIWMAKEVERARASSVLINN